LKNQNQDITLLLKHCAANNEKAQLTLYTMYYKAMYNVSYRIIGDSYLAEDIMQESFLKAFSKLTSYNGTVTFGAWLKRIVINTSINELKKTHKYQIEPLSTDLEVIDFNEGESSNYTELKADQVLKTIQSLKSNYKIILTLFFIEGYDLDEITSILNISNENCRTMMSRAKESLRKKLNKL
jgi:RNA polymerase sigma-70 factor (ECF subfamily)